MSVRHEVEQSGTFRIGGELPVFRLGYGTMQLTGPGVWGPPADPQNALAVLRRAVELGIDLIDTADSYGPSVAEGLVHDALFPYPDGLVIATKAGHLRTGPDQWIVHGDPDYLRQQIEMSLRIFGLDRLDLFQLHRIDLKIPLADQIGVLSDMRDEGKIRFIGLSEVDVDQLEAAQRITPIASVQNRYNLIDRASEDVLDYAEAHHLAFIPWFPLATGVLAGADSPLTAIARRLDATPSQVALAWLLQRSPVMLPIPGTSSVAHLEQNIAAAALELSDADVATLSGLASA